MVLAIITHSASWVSVGELDKMAIWSAHVGVGILIAQSYAQCDVLKAGQVVYL